MAKWFEVKIYSKEISELEVVSETEKQVVVQVAHGKTRRAKVSHYDRIFPTLAEAQEFIVNRYTEKVRTLTEKLRETKAELAEFQQRIGK
jgi:hypothetical protein